MDPEKLQFGSSLQFPHAEKYMAMDSPRGRLFVASVGESNCLPIIATVEYYAPMTCNFRAKFANEEIPINRTYHYRHAFDGDQNIRASLNVETPQWAINERGTFPLTIEVGTLVDGDYKEFAHVTYEVVIQ